MHGVPPFGSAVVVFGSRLYGAYLEPHQEREHVALVSIDVVSSTDSSAVLRSNALGIMQENEFHCDGGKLWVSVLRCFGNTQVGPG
jgi:hypothetical protein